MRTRVGGRCCWRTASGAVSLGAVQFRARAEGGLLERYGVTLDRAGTPIDLVVLRQGTLQGSADLPPRLQAVAGLLATPDQGRRGSGRRRPTSTSPTRANLAVAARLPGAGRRPVGAGAGGRVAVARALAERLDAVGVEHVRTLAVDETRLGLGGTTGVGLRLGGGIERTTIRQRLLDAATRGIDGVWRRRADCLAGER